MSSKRRRIYVAHSSHQGTFRLSDLPVEPLTHVASYLAAPSRALFDVALNFEAKPSSASGDSGSSAIVGDQLDALDFGDIEKELAAKISDDDIRGVLLSIDAVNTVKKLRLTNCINITGVGLEPLRGSAIIQQIDLSLVGEHESPDLNPEPLISCTEVLPILNSIIERGECALKHLQFPKVWRKERNTESDFHIFLLRYNETLRHRDVPCLVCWDDLPTGRAGWIHINDGRYYGTQDYTCYNCMKHYCKKCPYISHDPCRRCKRVYCLHCRKVEECDYCEKKCCADCGDYKRCDQCNQKICYNCVVSNSVTCIECNGFRGRTLEEVIAGLGDAVMTWRGHLNDLE